MAKLEPQRPSWRDRLDRLLLILLALGCAGLLVYLLLTRTLYVPAVGS